MIVSRDPNMLFSQAERAFQSGDHITAANLLEQVDRLAPDHPVVLHLSALNANRDGRPDLARTFYERVLKIVPNDPAILNNAANFHADHGDVDSAIALFDRALAIAPGHLDAGLNRAILLGQEQRFADSRQAFSSLEASMADHARFWSARATMERAAGYLATAAEHYDRALACDASYQRALHGRARVALERSEPATVARFEALLGSADADSQIWLGYIQALHHRGDSERARDLLCDILSQQQEWIEALEILAHIDWETGRADAAFERLEAVVEGSGSANPELYRAYCRLLAGADLYQRAADVAAKGKAIDSESQSFTLLEAIYAGDAGDQARAGRLFAEISLQTVTRHIHEARHCLRTGDIDRAEALLNHAVDTESDNIAGWALRDLCWRLQDDARHAWLHGDERFIRQIDLELSAEQTAEIGVVVASLHSSRAFPIGQSLRGGTQTRGRLFEIPDDRIAALRKAIAQAIDRYFSQLPAPDETHPLLRYRDAQWRFGGSWSVNLNAAGYHMSHIHPEGIVSSACHLVLPEQAGGNDREAQAGWLEIGRPPNDLGIDLPPLDSIAPRAGSLILFPSTLYHGTRPFSAGRRLTAAFDILCDASKKHDS